MTHFDYDELLQNQLDNSGYADIGPGEYRLNKPVQLRAGATVVMHPAAVMVRDFARGSGWNGATFFTDKDAGRQNDITIQGGRFTNMDDACTGNVFSIAGDDVTIKDVTIEAWEGGRAMALVGDRMMVSGCRISGTSAKSGNGGIRFCGGEDFLCSGCYVESGDDAFQFVPIEHESMPFRNLSIRNGRYFGCTGHATFARLMVALVDLGLDCTIEGCRFSCITGSGKRRSISIVDRNRTHLVRSVAVSDCHVTGLTNERRFHEVRVIGTRDVSISNLSLSAISGRHVNEQDNKGLQINDLRIRE